MAELPRRLLRPTTQSTDPDHSPECLISRARVGVSNQPGCNHQILPAIGRRRTVFHRAGQRLGGRRPFGPPDLALKVQAKPGYAPWASWSRHVQTVALLLHSRCAPDFARSE